MVSEQGRFHATNPPKRKHPERNSLWWLVWIVILIGLLAPAIAYSAPYVSMLLI